LAPQLLAYLIVKEILRTPDCRYLTALGRDAEVLPVVLPGLPQVSPVWSFTSAARRFCLPSRSTEVPV